MKLWGGRFQKPTDPVFERFSRSLDSDQAIVHHDLRACTAHVLMLAEQGVISSSDCDSLVEAMRSLSQEILGGLEVTGSQEDIHSWVEAKLGDKVGELASLLRIGRSRNDLVATDLRLYVMESSRALWDKVYKLQQALIDKAKAQPNSVLPGYTHLQRAQPVLLAHHLLAHFWALERDRQRFVATHHSADCCVLGAGALAGSSWPIAPDKTAKLLGFSQALHNSLDGVSDRDFALEFLFACATCAIHLSRIAEELVLWSSSEFAFIRFDDAWSTGSSLMPQKKNPDPAELVRGKTGLFIGNLIDLLTTLKGLPLAYNRDLQQDKPPIFRSKSELEGCLEVMAGTISTLEFNVEAMAKAASDPNLLVTDLADYFVRHGLTFAKAHELAGRSLGADSPLNKEEQTLVDEAWSTLNLERAITLRSHRGAAGPYPVKVQLEKAQTALDASFPAHLASG